MNQLDTLDINIGNITNSVIGTSCTGSAIITDSITINSETLLTVDHMSITGKQLASKLKLLDRIIAEHYPELQI